MKYLKSFFPWAVNPFALILALVFIAQYAGFPFLREHTLTFILFAFFYLFVPALALSSSIFRETDWGQGIRLILAYPLVLCAYFGVAWVIAIVQVPQLVHVLPIAAIAVLGLSRNRLSAPKNVIGNPDTWLMVAVFVLAITFMWAGLWLPGAPPIEGQIGVVYQDHLWNVGNVWSAIRGGWPLMDARAVGEPLAYHLSQSFVHSVAYRVTDIHPLYLQNYFFPVLDLFFLAAVLVWGARVVAGLSFYPVLWMCVALLIAKGWGWYYHGHVFWNPLTFFFSLAPFTLFVFVIKAYFEGRTRLPIMYLAALYFFLIATKMSLALIILPALAATFMLRVIKGETFAHKHELLLGIFCIAETFAVKYMLFSSGERGLFIGAAVEGSRVWEWLGSHLHGVPAPIMELIFGAYLVVTRLPVFLVSPAGGVLVVLGIVLYKLKDRMPPRRDFIAWSYFIVAMVLVSVIERYFLQYEEYANGAGIYFEWYPMWLLPVFVAGLLSLIPIARQVWILVISITSVGVVAYVGSVVPFYVSTLDKNAIVQLDTRATIDSGEWAALMWVNRNLPERAIIASDRRAFRGQGKTRDLSRFFAYSGLSGRQLLMEGEDFIGGEARTQLQQRWLQFETILAHQDAPALKVYLQATPAQYFFQSLRFDKMDLSQLSDYKLIYENTSVRIFSIPHAQ